ncbi:hypothetical protein VCHA53O466_40039 [Vibrio chagasii]|nr:hypothetical protein VCHA53O466_40039 [Vibrio chagasii]
MKVIINISFIGDTNACDVAFRLNKDLRDRIYLTSNSSAELLPDVKESKVKKFVNQLKQTNHLTPRFDNHRRLKIDVEIDAVSALEAANAINTLPKSVGDFLASVSPLLLSELDDTCTELARVSNKIADNSETAIHEYLPEFYFCYERYLLSIESIKKQYSESLSIQLKFKLDRDNIHPVADYILNEALNIRIDRNMTLSKKEFREECYGAFESIKKDSDPFTKGDKDLAYLLFNAYPFIPEEHKKRFDNLKLHYRNEHSAKSRFARWVFKRMPLYPSDG